MGISRDQSSKWQKIASIPEDKFEGYLGSQKELTTAGALRLAVNVNDGTGIRWTDETWNPWYGCVKISPGCKNCYMYRDREQRYGVDDPSVVTCALELTFNEPIKWKEPRKVFTCSWSDFFIAEADDWRDEAWDIIRQTPHLTYQILTKRPEDISSRLPSNWGSGWENVWLGVSVENTEYLHRVEVLKDIPAVIKFVSYEPALGYVDFTPYASAIDWLISGGESGNKKGYIPRPAELDWFRQVRDDCIRSGIAYFHKQHGGISKIDGEYGGLEIDGKTWNEFPDNGQLDVQTEPSNGTEDERSELDRTPLVRQVTQWNNFTSKVSQAYTSINDLIDNFGLESVSEVLREEDMTSDIPEIRRFWSEIEEVLTSLEYPNGTPATKPKRKSTAALSNDPKQLLIDI